MQKLYVPYKKEKFRVFNFILLKYLDLLYGLICKKVILLMR